MRIAIYGATGAVGSTLLIHLLKGADLQPGDEILLIGREEPTNLIKLIAMRADLLDAFDAGIVTLHILRSIDDLDHADVFIMAAGATIRGGVRSRVELAAENAPLFEQVASRLSARCPSLFVLLISNPVELAVSI